MNTVVKAGLVLGLLCEVWTYLMGFTGWYKDPALMNLFYVVIAIEVGVLIWALRQTAAQGRKYGGQVAAGTSVSAVGAVVIFVGSVLFTAVVFPDYFQELAAIQEQMMADQGLSEEQIRPVLDAQAAMSTPVINALIGSVMTVITGCLASLVIGAFVKAK